MALDFDERVAGRIEQMSPAERRVVRFFQENREEVLIASAAALAAMVGTSDTTILRATRSLGFSGLEHLRRTLSMHTATLGLIEIILVGIATKRPKETLATLKELNDTRTKLAGTPPEF